MLRMGRLAWHDPHWTPNRTHPVITRALPSQAVDGREIVAAVHQAADAFADLAAGGAVAVTAAGRAGRLYVLTRTLPGTYDVPRRYATAPAERAWPLVQVYLTAQHASAQAAAALADLALATDAPSATLALARAASTSHQPPARSHSHPTPTSATVADGPSTPAAMPGPVEQAVHQLRLDDPALLLRAAAIDHAARTLLTQAGQAAAQPSSRTTGNAARPGDAARLAARGFPAGLAIKPAASTPGNRTAPRQPAGRHREQPHRPSHRSRPPSRRAR
jgi:hypothetical protein